MTDLWRTGPFPFCMRLDLVWVVPRLLSVPVADYLWGSSGELLVRRPQRNAEDERADEQPHEIRMAERRAVLRQSEQVLERLERLGLVDAQRHASDESDREER